MLCGMLDATTSPKMTTLCFRHKLLITVGCVRYFPVERLFSNCGLAKYLLSCFQQSPTAIPAPLIGIFHSRAVCEVRLSKLLELIGLAIRHKDVKCDNHMHQLHRKKAS